MSTFKDIMEQVDCSKPNSIHERVKLKWLTALDGRIAADIFLMDIAQIQELPHTYPDAMDAEPLVSYPHDDLYIAYLEAKIDYANGDYNDYQNCMEAYNQLYSGFRLWFASVYDPVQGCRKNLPTYYITAYGLAVKAGFTGTMEAWLDSLHGPKGDPGKTAYQYAVEGGYTGSEEEFGKWLIKNGKTAYEYAKEAGYTGTEAEFAEKMAVEYASKDHNHDGTYSPTNHNHEGTYSPATHNHEGTYSPANHNHDGTYSPTNHNHDGTYSPASHNHDGSYAPKNHDHNGSYLGLGGGTMTGAILTCGIILREGVDFGTAFPENPVENQLFFLYEEGT